MNRQNSKRRGQGATEYVIILVLVAIGSIAIISVFGEQLRNLFVGATQRLEGDNTPVENATIDTNTKINVNEF